MVSNEIKLRSRRFVLIAFGCRICGVAMACHAVGLIMVCECECEAALRGLNAGAWPSTDFGLEWRVSRSYLLYAW